MFHYYTHYFMCKWWQIFCVYCEAKSAVYTFQGLNRNISFFHDKKLTYTNTFRYLYGYSIKIKLNKYQQVSHESYFVAFRQRNPHYTFKYILLNNYKVINETQNCIESLMSSKVNIDQSKQMFVSNGRRQQILNEQRKRLQQLRLQTQSQNTKLLKIQQKEREVESQYQNEKKNMDNTLAKLSVQAQQFARKQKIITREFENQKEQIFTNDRKKETYLKQKQQLQQRNKRRRHQIQQKQEKLNQKRIELQYIRTNIKKYQIYEEFLKQFRNMSDEFATSQVDQYGVMSILQRYFTMEKKKSELIQRHKKIQNQKEIRSKKIQKVKKQKEQKILQFNSKIKDLKQKIDSLNEQNQQLESQLEGKLNEIGQRQRQIGQVIFSIRGLYQSIAGQQKQAYKSTIEMLKTIREQRKRLRQYLDLFTEKNKEKRTV